MKAMIMAAGVGSRLEPLTCNIPKPMVPVVNRPAMEHIIQLLVKNEITQIAANLWYLPDKVQSHFGDGSNFGVQMHYSIEKDLMGTAGGVKKLESFLNETFVVISGDALTDIDLWKLIENHRKSGAIATIALQEVDDPQQFGVVITDETGKIKAFQEKPKPEEALSRLANTGIYVFEPEIFKLIPENTVYDFGKQLFPKLVEIGAAFYGHPMKGYWCDVGSLLQYRLGNYDVLNGKIKLNIPGNWHSNGVYIGEKTIIAPTARIGSKVVVGKDCHIGPNVEIFGETVIGDHCVINEATAIFGSIIWEGSRIDGNARLVECIVGKECNIQQNTVINSGVIMGDQCLVESGSNIATNTKIGPGSIVRREA